MYNTRIIQMKNIIRYFYITGYKILQCIDDRNKILQSKKTSIDESSMHFQQLATEIQQIKVSWNDLLLESQSVASALNLTTEFKITSRVRRKKHFHDDILDEQPFHDIENKFKVCNRIR